MRLPLATFATFATFASFDEQREAPRRGKVRSIDRYE
nr:hypothetical protein [Gordonia westfalica]